MLTDSLVTSDLFYNFSSWAPLLSWQSNRISATYSQIQGPACRVRRNAGQQHSPQTEVLIVAERFDADTFVRLAKSRLMRRISAHGPAVLRLLLDRLMHIQGPWVAKVHQDFVSIQQMLGCTESHSFTTTTLLL